MGREKVFRFKQFSVLNDRTAMKVGTDGVLLGAWCPVAGVRRALDVGTGCGVIGLMIAQRNSEVMIDAIDIDYDAVEEATTNFANSPWSNRLTAMEQDFNDIDKVSCYDLIVSNPPYFTNGVLPTGNARTTARHTGHLTYRQLIEGASRLLNDDGSLALISPVDVERDIIEASTFASLEIRCQTYVIPVEGSGPKRILWLLSRQQVAFHQETLIIADRNGNFTRDYIALTGDFYLKL